MINSPNVGSFQHSCSPGWEPSYHIEVMLPQLQDAGDVASSENPPHIVVVTNIQTSIGAAGQSDRGHELVPVSEAVAAGAGNAAPAPVSHHAADHRGLLRDEDVLSISHVKNT